MNKQEFKSAYNKITLSEEFKVQARAKLTEQFGKVEERVSDNLTEERASTVMAITPKKRSPWKSVIGIGSAAAVVGLGIWGGSVWLDRTSDPLDGQPTTEVTESAESADIVETTESIEIAETIESTDIIAYEGELVEHGMVFPAYYDKLNENNIDIFSVVPFQMDISLPEGWEILVLGSKDRGGFSMVHILDEDSTVVGAVDFNVYEKYEGMEYGAPDYYRMVFNQLMLGSRINWGNDYTEVKTDGWLRSATCRIGSNVSEPGYNDKIEYTSGILAYEDDMQVYVNISFDGLLDEKLHADIAKSIDIHASTIGLAERLADLVLELEGIRILGPNGFTDIAVTAVDTPCGTYVAVAYPEQVVTEGYDGMSIHRTLSLYSIYDNRLNGIVYHSDGWICSFNSSDSVLMYENGENILFVEEKVIDGYKTFTYNNFYPEECTFEELTYFKIVQNESSNTYAIKFDDGYDGDLEIHMTEAQYNEAVSNLLDGYTLVADLPCQPEDMTHHIATYFQSVVDVIEEALQNMDKQPTEEPAPMPPNLFFDAAGAERPLLMGSYTWGAGADQFHHDGYTIDDVISTGIGYVYPASWFEEARLVIPKDGVITSVTLHRDEQNYTALEFTADGAIILPDDPIGEHIWVTVEYPEGACRYHMRVDFPETAEPPAVTLNGEVLTIGSYIWNGELSGDHPRNKDVYQMFLDGELLTVTDTYTVDVTLSEGARLIEAVCLGADLDAQMQLRSEEYGRVYLPTANAKGEGIVRLSVEYPDGSVSYWLGFRHETQSSIPETLTATADDIKFALREGTGDWSDKTLFRLENNAHHIEVVIPEGSAVTDARAIDAEAGERDLIWSDDGMILMPYYATQLIRVTVTFSQGEGVYWFIYKTECAPAITAFADGSFKGIDPLCSYWGWEYVVWEVGDDGFGYQQALEMYRNGGQLPYLMDAEYFELALPEYTSSVKVTYYDENGVYGTLDPDENGIYMPPDAPVSLIKVSISCYGGTCEYWFSHIWGVCGNEELDESYD